MRKVILYIAASLNGKIARADGSVAWLNDFPPPENSDYGYSNFYESIETTIQGNKTYQQVLEWDIDFPYKGKENFVFTKNPSNKTNENVTFVSENHLKFAHDLKNRNGGNIWLIGGSQLNTFFLNARLIDEIRLFLMPIILPDGIDIFQLPVKQNQLKLVETEIFSNGVMGVRYLLNDSK